MFIYYLIEVQINKVLFYYSFFYCLGTQINSTPVNYLLFKNTAASLAAKMYDMSAKLTFIVGGKKYMGVQKAPGGA